MAIARFAALTYLCLSVGCTGQNPPAPPSSDLSVDEPTNAFQIAPEDSAVLNKLAPKTTQPVELLSGQTSWLDQKDLPWTYGYLQFMNGREVGLSKITISPSRVHSKEMVEIQRTDSMQIAGQAQKLMTQLVAFENTRGQLSNFELKLDYPGGHQQLTKGTLRMNSLSLTQAQGETQKQTRIRFEKGVWGVMGIQSMLMARMPAVGERISAQTFIPRINQVANVELVGGAAEMTTLGDQGTAELRVIECTLSLVGPEQSSTSISVTRNFVDDSGRILKMVTLGQPTIVSLMIAKEELDLLELQNQIASALDHALPCEIAAEAMDKTPVVTVEANDIDPFQLIPRTRFQDVVSLGPRTLEVRFGAYETSKLSPPTASDKTVPPNPGKATRDWLNGNSSQSVDALIEEFVQLKESLSPSGINPKFPALDSLFLERQADPLLLAEAQALALRAHGIPSRIGFGLQLKQPHAVFGCWTLYWDRQREGWFPVLRSDDSKHQRLLITSSSWGGNQSDFQKLLDCLEGISHLKTIRLSPASE